VLVAGRVYLAI